MNYFENRLKRAQSLFDNLGLDSGLISLVEEINADSNKNSYHNFQHLLTVSIRSIEGGEFYNLSTEEKRSLGVAGLCHDLCYKVGEDESRNIPRAVEELKKIYSHCPVAPQLVRATEFPHSAVSSLAEKIIQDADLMQVLEPDYQVFLNGLTDEWNNGVEADPRFPGEDAFNTEWAKEIFRNTMKERYSASL